MIQITAVTTNKFFGEPLYLGERIKDLVTAALGVDRHDLRFTHKSHTNMMSEADITITIDSVGNVDVAGRLEAALQESLPQSRLSYLVRFTTNMDDGATFATNEALDQAVIGVLNDEQRMMHAHLVAPYRAQADFAGELREQAVKLYDTIWGPRND